MRDSLFLMFTALSGFNAVKAVAPHANNAFVAVSGSPSSSVNEAGARVQECQTCEDTRQCPSDYDGSMLYEPLEFHGSPDHNFQPPGRGSTSRGGSLVVFRYRPDSVAWLRFQVLYRAHSTPSAPVIVPVPQTDGHIPRLLLTSNDGSDPPSAVRTPFMDNNAPARTAVVLHFASPHIAEPLYFLVRSDEQCMITTSVLGRNVKRTAFQRATMSFTEFTLPPPRTHRSK